MKISMDYEAILRDRVIIVTGAGRSGTTILGKLVGSMEPAFYFFEPTLIKFGAAVSTYSKCLGEFIVSESDLDILRASFVEDFILPMIQGRNINMNHKDDSWIGHYENPRKHVKRMIDLPRRDDTLEYIERINPKFIIKLTDVRPAIEYMEVLFPGMTCINIIRNPNDVISSAIKRDWWTDEWLETAPELMAQNALLKTPMPWYIEHLGAATQEQWEQWSPITRAACSWLAVKGDARDSAHIMFYYDKMIRNPNLVIDWIERSCGLERTNITIQHFNSILNYPEKQHKDIINDIEEPIRKKILTYVQG